MLDLILQILSIIGIILLVLLILMIAALLLALFFPVSYHIRGSGDEEGLRASAKARWLFGLLRADYSYPEPGNAVVKALWFTLYNSQSTKAGRGEEKAGKTKSRPDTTDSTSPESLRGVENDHGSTNPESRRETEEIRETGSRADFDNSLGTEGIQKPGSENVSFKNSSEPPGQPASGKPAGIIGKISLKLEKIKYTIRSIYDKIKKIWENISYYLELLQEENTKQLFSHAMLRIGKILKCIRPRHIKADILFGTGSPDTTGYIYGIYCMLSAIFGTKATVTPDFEQAVLKGEIEVSGHVVLWILLVNGLALLLDKKLQLFRKKLKKEKTKSVNKAA